MVYVILSRSTQMISRVSQRSFVKDMLTKVCLVPLTSTIHDPQIMLSLRQAARKEMQPAELFTRFLACGTCASGSAREVCHLGIVDEDGVVAVVVDLVAVDVDRGACAGVSTRVRWRRRYEPVKFSATESPGVLV